MPACAWSTAIPCRKSTSAEFHPTTQWIRGLQNAPWHTVRRQDTTVCPINGVPNVLMYNTKSFPTAPTSWDVVFKAMNLPDGKSNKDRVQGYVGPIYIADAALYLKAHNPELGITDPYELTEAQFDAALALAQGAAQDRLQVLGRLPLPGRRLQDRRLCGSSLLAVPGEPAAGRQGSRSPARFRRKAPPAGPTRP